MRRRWIGLSAAALAVGLALAALAQDDDRHPVEGGVIVVHDRDLAWFDAEVPGFDPGMQMAIVHGDPSLPDEPYVIRLSFPDGYRYPSHWHPLAENITVLEGTFRLGVGERRAEARVEDYRAGDFVHVPARRPHFGGVRGFTVIQVHGQGPLHMHLVDPEVGTQPREERQ